MREWIGMNVGIVGAGRGGSSLLKTLCTVPDVRVIGIIDRNPSAPGIVLARSRGIPNFTDLERLMRIPGQKIIIDATGVAAVKDEIHSLKTQDVTIVDAEAALLMMATVRAREAVMMAMEEQSEGLSALAEELIATMKEISASTHDLSANSSALAARAEKLAEVSAGGKKQVAETAEVLNFIKAVSDQTKLIGLNAAIEAARAGEHGRGFNVVAQKVRELAENTNKSAKQIANILDEIEKSILGTMGEAGAMKAATEAAAEQQAQAADAINQAAGKIQGMAANLSKLSADILSSIQS